MDFMPDIEFHFIFDRVTRTVSLKGCTSVNDINKRIKNKVKQIKKEAHKKRGGKARYSVSQLRKLLFRGFGRRTINEAIVDPNGKISLTLQHGRKKAREILLARARKRLGPLRRRRR